MKFLEEVWATGAEAQSSLQEEHDRARSPQLVNVRFHPDASQHPYIPPFQLLLHLHHNQQTISGFVTDYYNSLVIYPISPSPVLTATRITLLKYKLDQVSHVSKTHLLHISLR